MKTPPSMESDLAQWNAGNGIEMDGWLCGSGNYSLATAYTMYFNPKFLFYKGFIALEDEYESYADFDDSINRFMNEEKTSIWKDRWVIQQLFLDGIHYLGCEDISIDKLTIIGNALKEIYEAKLGYLFPNLNCFVEFNIPKDKEKLDDYELLVWQKI